MLQGGQVTQRCLLDLATLLSWSGGLLSSFCSVKVINRGKDKTAGPGDRAPQAWRKADICVGTEGISSEGQTSHWV